MAVQLESKPTTNYMEEGFFIPKEDEDSDEVIHIPYNINNILVKEQDIIDLLAHYGVTIKKVNRLDKIQVAFTHQSYVKKDIYPEHVLKACRKEINNPNLVELQDESYQTLEYIGDRVLKIVISIYLYYRYVPLGKNEGFMTRLQTKIEDKKNLAIFSQKLGLQKFFLISRQNEQIKGRNSESINEDIFESFMGALMLSNGFEVCSHLIINLLETQIDYAEKLYRDNNYKDQLLQYFHKKQLGFPKYFLIRSEGPPHKRIFTMAVEKPGSNPNDSLRKRGFSFGTGSSKKEGQQKASKMALILHGVLKDDQFDESDIYYPDWDNMGNDNSDTNNSRVFKITENIKNSSEEEMSDETSSDED